jgi:hypothetical protein
MKHIQEKIKYMGKFILHPLPNDKINIHHLK